MKDVGINQHPQRAAHVGTTILLAQKSSYKIPVVGCPCIQDSIGIIENEIYIILQVLHAVGGVGIIGIGRKDFLIGITYAVQQKSYRRKAG